ncbi:efflux pump antibiotic resistance protein [Filobasidium floriforme]|uniref:efflux pump antibiotic resistance protein n=1 Tax=Filobasidium floriforme TaxID=5210 RepID=UPI001E8D8699|nr:efflux pump antibiotic resistance protein [Filobasidium floriforme]KAH8084733.1 efflux pump antibiotic resistance protein [Filobasidium floriforme]
MASLETAHPATHPKEDSDEPEVWSDDKHGRSGDRHDLESGYTVDREGGLPLRQPAHPDIEASANRIAESYLNPGAGSNTIAKEPEGTTELEQRSADSGSGGTDPTGPQSGATTLQDQTNLLPAKQIIVVFLGLSCALFVSLLDQTIVSTALPTLGRVFSRAEISSWVATSYLLTSTSVQPIYSRLSDIFGRKILLVFCLILFSLGSLACALSQSMIQLIVFRALAGLGGGGILTLVMIVVGDVVTLRERGKYQGILGGVVAFANSIGPVLGGVLTEKASWRWCFWINLPMAGLAIAVVVFALPLRSVQGDIRSKLKKVDYAGCALTLAFSVLILMALSWGGTTYPWDSAGVLAPLLVGLALLGLFIFVEWKLVPLPLIPMRIFRSSTVSGAMVATFLSGMVFYAQLFYLPQYFQVVRGESAIRSGVLLLPLIVVQTITSFTSGVIVSKTGDYRINLYLGFGIWTIGIGLLTTIGPDTSIAKICGYQILSGIGGGQTFQTSLVAIQAAVNRSEMAVATGARNFIRMLGGSVALAASSALLNNAVKNELYRDANFPNDMVRQIVSDPTQINDLVLSAEQKTIALRGYTQGIHNVFYLLLPCCGVSFFVIIFFVKHHSLERSDDAALKQEGKDRIKQRKQKPEADTTGSGPGAGTEATDIK